MPRNRSIRLRLARTRRRYARRIARGAIRRPECADFLRLVLQDTNPYRDYQIHRAGEIFVQALRKT